MQHIEGQPTTNSKREMGELGEYIPLPPLTTIKDKTDFIFLKLNTNQCTKCVSVNFETNTSICQTPNCNKFHRSYKTNNNTTIRNVDIVMCRYDNDCKMNLNHQCKFIHTEQIIRWYKFYIDMNSLNRMITLIFLEISRSIEKQCDYHKKRQIDEENRIARERERERAIQIERERVMKIERDRTIQSRYEADRMRNYDRGQGYSRDRSRSRERAPFREPIRNTIYNSRSEIEKLNSEIEIAKKKKELAELSKMTELSKTQIDISKMVETAIAARMQSMSYQMPQATMPAASYVPSYQQYGGYGSEAYYPSYGAGSGARAGAGAGAYQYPSSSDNRGYQFTSRTGDEAYQYAYGSSSRY
jgi:hypothetical protein